MNEVVILSFANLDCACPDDCGCPGCPPGVNHQHTYADTLVRTHDNETIIYTVAAVPQEFPLLPLSQGLKESVTKTIREKIDGITRVSFIWE